MEVEIAFARPGALSVRQLDFVEAIEMARPALRCPRFIKVFYGRILPFEPRDEVFTVGSRVRHETAADLIVVANSCNRWIVRIVLRKLVGEVDNVRAIDRISNVDHVALGWMEHNTILIDDIHRRIFMVQPDRRGKTAYVQNHLNIGRMHLVEDAIKPREVELIF